jgi:hypothetical protein
VKNKYFFIGLTCTLALSSAVFYGAFFFQLWKTVKAAGVSDLPTHVEFVLKFAKENSFPAYSIWYRLVYLISGFSQDYNHLAITSIWLLSLLVGFKYLMTFYILNLNHHNQKIAAIISFVLIIVMPVISYYSCENLPADSVCITSVHIYLGNIAPNQWHNSTLILAMPVNLLLFYFAVKNVMSEKLSDYFLMGVLSVISILCKPNFAMAFLPVLCIAILVKNRNKFLLAVTKSALVATPAVIVLFYQWYNTFISNKLFGQGAKTIVAPFYVWTNYSPHITLSLLLSIAFPLIVLFFYYRKFDLYLKLSWLTFAVALMMAVMFAELPAWTSGNFFWGAIAANYVLFLSSISFLLKQPDTWISRFAYTSFGVHFVSGCAFIGGFFIGGFFMPRTSLMF